MINIIKNAAKILLKRKSFLFTTFILPIIIILIFANIEDGATSIKVGVINHDNGALSSEVIDTLKDSKSVEVTELSDGDYTQDLIFHKYELIVKVDEDYTENLLNGKLGEIKYNVLSAADSESVVKSILESETESLATICNNVDVEKEGIDKVIDTFKEDKPDYDIVNQKDKQPSIGLSLGIVFYAMFVSAGMSVGFLLEDERLGTKERILMSKASEKTYYVAMGILFFLFAAVPSIEYYVICEVENFTFGFESHYLLLLLSLGMSLLAVAFSVVITTFIKNKSVFGLVTGALSVPLFMLSGCFWDFDMMSSTLQNVGSCLPPRWVMKSIELLQGGSRNSSTYPYMLGLVVLSLVLFGLSIILTKKKVVLVKDNK